MGNIDGRIRFLEQYLRHAECPIKELRCFVCEKPISGYELSRMAPGEYPKHEGCSKVYNHQNCDVCKQQFIPVYSEHPWWRHKYCVVHGMDGTPECFSCGRVMSDCSGGKACCDCSESAVTCMESEEWHSLVANVHHFYRGLNMSFGELPFPFPLLLVDAPDAPPFGFGTCAFHKDKDKGILILRGLPRLICGAVLAHGMMHAWFRLQGYPPLPHHVEEGICQVLAHMWLDSQPQPDPDPRIIFQNNLTKFSRQLIAASPHPDGHAFRQAQHSIINYGLHTTLAHLRTAATLPPNDICSCTFMHYLHSYYH